MDFLELKITELSESKN